MINWQCGISPSFFACWKKGGHKYREDYNSLYAKDNRVLFATTDGTDGHWWEEKASQWRIDLLKFMYFIT
jgi:hypothetical protein